MSDEAAGTAAASGTVTLEPPVVQKVEYAGFWRRFGALWLDALFLGPLALVNFWLMGQTRYALLYMFLPGLVFGFWYYVLLVAWYGGTPGKLLLHTRVVMVDGSRVTLKAAFLRHAVQLITSFPVSLGLIMATLQVSDAEWFSLGWIARTQKLTELAPAWYHWASWTANGWVWSEYLTMMFNKRRRAVHDFIAGTVVIRQWRSGYAPIETADAATGGPRAATP